MALLGATFWLPGKNITTPLFSNTRYLHGSSSIQQLDIKVILSVMSVQNFSYTLEPWPNIL
jgi:hypothetical protein